MGKRLVLAAVGAAAVLTAPAYADNVPGNTTSNSQHSHRHHGSYGDDNDNTGLFIAGGTFGLGLTAALVSILHHSHSHPPVSGQ